MIIVLGSINLDLVTKTPRLLVAGETLQGYEFQDLRKPSICSGVASLI